MRKSHEITEEYTRLCAELGDLIFKHEIVKSQYLSKFQQLNQEMLKVTEFEKELEASKEKTDEVQPA